MHPAGGYRFDGSNGFQPAGRAKAMPDHGLQEDTHTDISYIMHHARTSCQVFAAKTDHRQFVMAQVNTRSIDHLGRVHFDLGRVLEHLLQCLHLCQVPGKRGGRVSVHVVHLQQRMHASQILSGWITTQLRYRLVGKIFVEMVL